MEGLKAVLLMVLLQILYAVLNILYKLAIFDGMSMRVASAYRLIFASAFTLPLALFFDWNNPPRITRRVLLMECLCGFFGGSLFLNLYFAALSLLPATFMLAINNLAPAVTFVMAIIFRLEKLKLGSAAGKAKAIGTLTGITGAMLLSFFRGFEIDIWKTHIDLLHPHHHHSNNNNHTPPLHGDEYGNKLLGLTYAIASCCSFSLWLNIQGKMNTKEYPSHLTGTAMMSTMGAIQATVFALILDRDWSQWRLGWNIRLLTVAYAGIVGSGIVVIITAWCIEKRGPLFASIFNPLQLVLVAVVASLILNENLYLGSVVGGVVIVIGLYTVLWGKSKEIQELVSSSQINNNNNGSSEAVDVVVRDDHHKSDEQQHTNNII
ncbi:hypothetical protein PIB30_006297 [Stylosanthes scabra]|uniref:WAT1-related protein n=1 Tax=Stylosanthes scabra TaxID=79078 RepID=A0ABU6R4Q9_9FABA|nr:hypothetical protein [Stylosanthes scabra]